MSTQASDSPKPLWRRLAALIFEHPSKAMLGYFMIMFLYHQYILSNYGDNPEINALVSAEKERQRHVMASIAAQRVIDEDAKCIRNNPLYWCYSTDRWNQEYRTARAIIERFPERSYETYGAQPTNAENRDWYFFASLIWGFILVWFWRWEQRQKLTSLDKA